MMADLPIKWNINPSIADSSRGSEYIHKMNLAPFAAYQFRSNSRSKHPRIVRMLGFRALRDTVG